jgi:hypothetical protein
MEAAHTSETSVDNYFTRQYIPEDNSELHSSDVPNRSSVVISKPGFWRPQVAFFLGRVWLLGLANQLRGIGEGFYGEQLMRSVTRLAAGHYPCTLILDFTGVGNVRSTDGHVRARSTFVERVKCDCIELSE